VLEHNVLEDPLEALGPGSFDLVCSRLALFHLVGKQEQAIRQMAKCLRPGGWLIDEDADWGTDCPGPGPPVPVRERVARGLYARGRTREAA
jgi:SAM-dependent methyltransferase